MFTFGCSKKNVGSESIQIQMNFMIPPQLSKINYNRLASVTKNEEKKNLKTISIWEDSKLGCKLYIIVEKIALKKCIKPILNL